MPTFECICRSCNYYPFSQTTVSPSTTHLLHPDTKKIAWLRTGLNSSLMSIRDHRSHCSHYLSPPPPAMLRLSQAINSDTNTLSLLFTIFRQIVRAWTIENYSLAIIYLVKEKALFSTLVWAIGHLRKRSRLFKSKSKKTYKQTKIIQKRVIYVILLESFFFETRRKTYNL